MKALLIIGLMTTSIFVKAESILCLGQTQNHNVALKITTNSAEVKTAKYDVVMTDLDPQFPTLQASFDLPTLQDGQSASITNVGPFYMVSFARKGKELELDWIDQDMDGYFTGTLTCSK